MRKALPFLAILLATAACGQQERRESTQDLKTYDVQEAPPAAEMVATDSMRSVAAPGIAPTAAPGVAFNYRYAFRLPGARVSAVQEQHAAACEKLGLDRCRITGMRYRLVNESDVEGMLAFKLDPAIARAFGKQGIDAVTQAEGMLVDSEISGVDVGSEIEAGTRTGAGLSEELRKVEEQLARPGLRAPERAELQAQAARLREAIRANSAGQSTRRESLAKTPVVFNYGSGDLVPGFDTHSPLKSAIETAGDNLIGGLAVMLVIAVTLLPWALLVLAAWWAWRRLRPLRQRREVAATAEAQSSEV
jgi:hypothetical protein